MARARDFRQVTIEPYDRDVAERRAAVLNERDEAEAVKHIATLKCGEVPPGPGIPIDEEYLAEAQAVLEHGRNPFRWVGFAAEMAIARAINAGDLLACNFPNTYDYDLAISRAAGLSPEFLRTEVKTRCSAKGWTDPARFDFVKVPTHDGRPPIKDVDLVLFAWWSQDQPENLWVLGRILGRQEFEKRAVFYKEGQQMPRGYAPKGGAWCIDVSMLRPLPDGFLKESK